MLVEQSPDLELPIAASQLGGRRLSISLETDARSSKLVSRASRRTTSHQFHNILCLLDLTPVRNRAPTAGPSRRVHQWTSGTTVSFVLSGITSRRLDIETDPRPNSCRFGIANYLSRRSESLTAEQGKTLLAGLTLDTKGRIPLTLMVEELVRRG